MHLKVEGQFVELDRCEKPFRFPWFSVGITLTVLVLALMGVLK